MSTPTHRRVARPGRILKLASSSPSASRALGALLAAAAALAVVPPAQARARADTPAPRDWVRREVKVGAGAGAKTRVYYEVVPPSCGPGKSCPLVLVFHGGGGDAPGMGRLTRFDAAAREQGFIAVFPEGIGGHWNDGRPEGESHEDDVGFVDALLDDAVPRLGADPARVYSTGISNGGLFSFRLACERAERFAAIAPVAAQLGRELSRTCRPRAPIAVLNIAGTEDRLMPFAGGHVSGPWGLKNRGAILSSDATFEFWAGQEGCGPAQPAEVVNRDPADGTALRREPRARCRSGADVVRDVILGGGHTWPGGDQYLPVRLVGRVSRELDATEEVWRFFSAHRKP